MDVGVKSGCTAVIPGYGFLSESCSFAELCAEHGLAFCGPSPETLSQFGLKHTARNAAKAADVPICPGTDVLESGEDAVNWARSAGDPYPLMLKAIAGLNDIRQQGLDQRPCCLLPAACCLLPIACCLLHVAGRLLPVLSYAHRLARLLSQPLSTPRRRARVCLLSASPLAVPWEHALTGCQLVQLALWFFAGSAKVGPWMKYVMCFMLPNSLLMRVTDAVGLLRFKSLFVDHPRGAHASACLTQPHVLLCLC